MDKKILKEYIVNAVISGIYILIGIWITMTSAHRQNLIDSRIDELESASETMNQLPYLIEKTLNFLENIINQFLMYVFGWLPLLAGITAIALSSIAAFYFMKDKAQKTTGYHITMIFSYSILGVITAVYLIIATIFSLY